MGSSGRHLNKGFKDPCMEKDKETLQKLPTAMHDKRFEITLAFLRRHIPWSDSILDLGEVNTLSDKMRAMGYKVTNTTGDLDLGYDTSDFKVITAFEIFEHMFAPFNILNSSKGKLVASVPLRLWFTPVYWNLDDDRDCHYHEFERQQFDLLLKRTGWRVKDWTTWTAPCKGFGIRPMLRRIYPKFYLVYAEKDCSN